RLVLYGFIEPHELRNIGHPLWLQLQAVHSRTGSVATPYCTLDGRGELVRHPPERYPQWPLRESLATVTFLEGAYADFTGRARAKQGRAVTQRLMLEMNHLSAAHGARFAVVLLHLDTPAAKDDYTAFLGRNGIDVIDCAYPLTPAMLVPRESHPNG